MSEGRGHRRRLAFFCLGWGGVSARDRDYILSKVIFKASFPLKVGYGFQFATQNSEGTSPVQTTQQTRLPPYANHWKHRHTEYERLTQNICDVYSRGLILKEGNDGVRQELNLNIIYRVIIRLRLWPYIQGYIHVSGVSASKIVVCNILLSLGILWTTTSWTTIPTDLNI